MTVVSVLNRCLVHCYLHASVLSGKFGAGVSNNG